MTKTNNITNGFEYTFVASNTASIPIVNIPSNVTALSIVYSGVKASTGVVGLIVQVSVNNGVSYITSGYASGVNWAVVNSSSFSNQSLGSGLLIAQEVNANEIQNGQAYIYGLNSPFLASCSGTCNFYDGSNCFFGLFGGQLISGSTGANAIQILYSAGNISSGTFKVYGIA